MLISKHQGKFRLDHNNFSHTANTLEEAIVYARGFITAMKYVSRSIGTECPDKFRFCAEISEDEIDAAINPFMKDK